MLEDTGIAHIDPNSKVSINVVSEHTPPSVPTNNADVIYAWCFSYLYDHKTESKCFYLAKAINTMISERS